MTVDLFGTPTVVGIEIKLDRDIDRAKPCHDNLAVIHPGKAQHAGEFRCAACDAHRGWCSKSQLDFILELLGRFGAPAEPIIVRQQQKGMTMAFEHKTNRGSIFRNEDKADEKDRDYSGQLNVEGRMFWVSGFVAETKAGKKYLNLIIKPQQDTAPSKAKSRADDLNDAIPF
jgi:hypothetical protein